MADSDGKSPNNENIDENDAKEDAIVEDTDADTKDIENTQNENYDRTEQRFAGIEATLDKILGQLSALREAQGVMVENGAVVHEDDVDFSHVEEDEFISPLEMDLLV